LGYFLSLHDLDDIFLSETEDSAAIALSECFILGLILENSAYPPILLGLEDDIVSADLSSVQRSWLNYSAPLFAIRIKLGVLSLEVLSSLVRDGVGSG